SGILEAIPRAASACSCDFPFTRPSDLTLTHVHTAARLVHTGTEHSVAESRPEAVTHANRQRCADRFPLLAQVAFSQSCLRSVDQFNPGAATNVPLEAPEVPRQR